MAKIGGNMKYIIALLAGIIPMVPALVLFINRRHSPTRIARRTILGLSAVNLIVALVVIGLATASLILPGAVQAENIPQQVVQPTRSPLAYIGAAIAVSIGAIGAGYAVGNVGSAAVGAIAEKPEVFGRALIFVGLAEGVAIYGLIIAFIILR
jgi:V/A-type H+-transporting ATPase subunit K